MRQIILPTDKVLSEIQLKYTLEKEGYDYNYHLLDSATLFNSRTGVRIFSSDIKEIEEYVHEGKTKIENLRCYSFLTNEGKYGVLISDDFSGERDLSERFYQKTLQLCAGKD